MPPNAKQTRKCPSCGFKLTKGQKTCPQCGKKLAKGGKRSPGGKGKSPKTAKFDCPNCGALIPKSSKKCPACKANLLAAAQMEQAQPVVEDAAEPRTELIEPNVLEATHEVKKLVCPACTSDLEGTESKCPICGESLKEEVKTEAPPAPVEPAPVEKAFEFIEEERTSEAPPATVEEERPKEPIAPVEPTTEEPPVTLEDVKKPEEPETPTVPEIVEAPPETAGAPESGDSRPCPACDSIIPKDFQKCPICDAEFGEPTHVAEETEPLAELAEVAPTVDTTTPAEKNGAKPARKRKLRSEKVTKAPVTAPTTASGRTNGVSYVNGLGRPGDRGVVNGTGVTNGNGFVNGTRAAGAGGRAETAAARRPSERTRWQLLAVLVAIIVILSVFVFLAYSDFGDEFSVDGDYDEWDSATTYGTRIESTAPSSNIAEWAVGTQSSDLFLYFKTESNMMSTSQAECYYLFVDSDGSNETGYVMESIGADFMFQLAGWDSAVKSSSLLQYGSASDQYDWNAWGGVDSLSYSLDGGRLEAGAHMPETIGPSAKFVLLSKDAVDRGSVSYTAPLKGGVLVVRQAPAVDVALSGIVSKSISAAVLTLKFTCQGEGGEVSQVNPTLAGAVLTSDLPGFTLAKGEGHEVTVTLDTSAVADGELISAEVFSSGIVSTFAHVEIIGSGARAYTEAAPSSIAIDGAFADWAGQISADLDQVPVTIPGVDIDEVGDSSTSLDSYFYVSVKGEMCSGTFIPATVTKFLGGGGGGVVIPTRHTAEDILTVYVDSDKSNTTGALVELDPKKIGADHKIEVRGVFGMITSVKEFDYSASTSKWIETAESVEVAKDEQRIEIGVSAESLGGSSDIDFIVETTSWNGQADLAMFDSSTMLASALTWIVDPTTSSPFATSMSYQRKMFYDGVNHWSLYFDGSDTVYKYSADNGQTWTYGGIVFATSGVNEASIWYDAPTNTVYAVGDRASASTDAYVQIGTVDAAAHTISWAASDSSVTTSAYPLAGKNTYISKDSNGYLWVLSSNLTSLKLYYDLSAFRSTAVNNTSSWMDTGSVLPYTDWQDTSKGSIVPAGSGSDMWAVYTYQGYVAARKYDGTWPANWDQMEIYAPESKIRTNTDNSPPSVVVDGNGVVHVVYGTGFGDKSGNSKPRIEYSHSNTDLTFTAGLNLDGSSESIGNYYPTISLETSTDSLYVLWLQSDTTLAPKTVMGRKCVSDTWSNMTIEQQTSHTKMYLTSIYSASGEYKICWQWTQNTTAPIQVLYDSFWIPEFGDLTPLVCVSIVLFAVYRRSSRGKDDLTG